MTSRGHTFSNLHFLWILFQLILVAHIIPTIIAKEIIATYEWQKLGPTDTVPAGLEIRMDLSGGGKWARLPPKEIDDGEAETIILHKKRCSPSCKERQKERAEKRRAAGFLLREPTHKYHKNHQRREQETGNHLEEWESPNIGQNSLLHLGGVFVGGLTIGIGIMTRIRRRGGSGMHEH